MQSFVIIEQQENDSDVITNLGEFDRDIMGNM